MCNKLCTYRKILYLDNTGNNYDCTENPHIILSAKEFGGVFSAISPSGLNAVNIYSTNFHIFYLDIYNAWVQNIQSAQQITASFQVTPQFATLTQSGFLVGNLPLPPNNNTLQITESYNTYNVNPVSVINTIVNYSKPPFDFAENLSANQYVAPALYDLNQMGFTVGGNPYMLVEFLDVTGKYCQYA